MITELTRIFGHKLGTLIDLAIHILLFWGGFLWVKKKEASPRGFLYHLLLVLQILFVPYHTLLSAREYNPIIEDPISAEALFNLLAIGITIHGAYCGVRLLTVTDKTKRGMKLNLFLRFILSLIGTITIFAQPSEYQKLSDLFPYYWVQFYAAPILVLAFLFTYYQFVITLKNDEPNPENTSLPSAR